jgi:hypothetical protein
LASPIPQQFHEVRAGDPSREEDIAGRDQVLDSQILPKVEPGPSQRGHRKAIQPDEIAGPHLEGVPAHAFGVRGPFRSRECDVDVVGVLQARGKRQVVDLGSRPVAEECLLGKPFKEHPRAFDSGVGG